MRNMGKLVCTPTTSQPHPVFATQTQINAPAAIDQCAENVQLVPIMPTSNIHATPPLTHRNVNLVSLPRASIPSENLLRYRFLNVCCAQHGQTCVHANNMPATSLCLRPGPNKCTRFNQPMHRKRSVVSYAYEQYTRKPSSDSQRC